MKNIIIICLLLLVSCSSTTIMTDKNEHPTSTEKETLVIIALTLNDNARTQFELSMHKQLLEYHISSVSSRTIFDIEFTSYNTLEKTFSKLIATIDKQGYKNVMITMVTNTEAIIDNNSNIVIDKIYHLETQIYGLEDEVFTSHWNYCLHILESELTILGMSFYTNIILQKMEEDLFISKQGTSNKKIPHLIWTL